jgi:hypothetical protein
MKSLLYIFLFGMNVIVHAAEVIDIASNQGAPTRTLLAPTPNPKATVLLFIGGDGQLRLTDNGQTTHGHTFVRSIDYWASHQINAVLIDSPFSLGSAKREIKRGRNNHLARVAEVTAYYAKETRTPLWIFGHSLGTSTVAAFLSSGKPEVELLRGYVVAGTHQSESVPISVKLPVLGIHHQKDGCEVTPLQASESIINSRSPDTPRSMVLMSGGEEKGHRCLSLSHHGFNGIEKQFIDTAASFILKN